MPEETTQERTTIGLEAVDRMIHEPARLAITAQLYVKRDRMNRFNGLEARLVFVFARRCPYRGRRSPLRRFPRSGLSVAPKPPAIAALASSILHPTSRAEKSSNYASKDGVFRR